MSVREYIGARYVPIFADPTEWSSANAYEPLTIVTNQGNSYTSKQYVPIGIDISNEEYWVLTSNFNSQIEQYRQEVQQLATKVDGLEDTVGTQGASIGTLQSDMEGVQSSVGTLQTDVASLQSSVGTLETNVASLQSNVGTLQNGLSGLQSDVTNLTSRVSALETATAKSSGTITWVADWVDDGCYIFKVGKTVYALLNASYLSGSAFEGVYATIPSGFRPKSKLRSPATMIGAASCEAGYMEFRTNGEVFIFSGNATAIQVACYASWEVS